MPSVRWAKGIEINSALSLTWEMELPVRGLSRNSAVQVVRGMEGKDSKRGPIHPGRPQKAPPRARWSGSRVLGPELHPVVPGIHQQQRPHGVNLELEDEGLEQG